MTSPRSIIEALFARRKSVLPGGVGLVEDDETTSLRIARVFLRADPATVRFEGNLARTAERL